MRGINNVKLTDVCVLRTLSLSGCDDVPLGKRFLVFKRHDDTFEMSRTAHLWTQHHAVGDLDGQ